MQVLKVLLPAVVCFFLCSCDLFDTRKSEQPEIEATNVDFPSSPEILMKNFTSSITDRSSQNYSSCFTDSSFAPTYHFFPTNNAVNVYPVFSGNWDVRAERRYFENILVQLNKDSLFTINLTNTKLTRYSDSAFYSAHYLVSFYVKNTEVLTTAEGDMQMTMYLDSRSRWAIGQWTDINSVKKNCWSDLKGIFY